MTGSRSIVSPRRVAAVALVGIVTSVVMVASSSAAPAPAKQQQAQQETCDRNLGTVGEPGQRTGACAQAGTAELIWQGRTHLGDEPGIYGDGESFPGLAMELPITLERTSSPGADRTTIILETKDVQTFAGYPGHPVTVTIYVPDPALPFHAKPVVLVQTNLTSADNNRKEIPINLANFQPPYYIGVRVQVDTTVPPGALDDFLVTRLSNLSSNFRFIASFGFLPPPPD
jgi:hypothetical protein